MIVITAFDPFGGMTHNPSQQLVEAFAARHPDPTVQTHILPTAFAGAAEGIAALIRDGKPKALIMLGVAETREAISLEETAFNWDEARIADNDGFQPLGRVIVPEGPERYPSSLPLDIMASRFQSVGIPTTRSNDPGRFVCNHTFYVAMHLLHHQQVPAGFVHVPLFDKIVLEKQIEALEITVDLLKQNDT